MNNRLFIGVILLLLFSCKQTVDKQELPSYFCRPELETFFGGPDTLPVVTFSPNNSFEGITKLLTVYFDTINPVINYRVILKMDSSHRAIFIKAKQINPNLYRDLGCVFNTFETRINSENELLIEGEISQVDEVKIRYKNYLKELYAYKKSYRFSINLIWDKSASCDTIFKTLQHIVHGYTEHINEFAQTKFKKPLSSLSRTEIEELLILFPFHLFLRTTQDDTLLIPVPLLESLLIEN